MFCLLNVLPTECFAHRGCAEYAAARAYDKALLTQRPPAELQNTLNFPVQDYTADTHQVVKKAAASAAKELRRLYAIKRRRQQSDTPHAYSQPAAGRQHRSADHGHGAHLVHDACLPQSGKAGLEPAAKRRKREQPVPDAQHSRPGSASQAQRLSSDADSLSGRPSAQDTDIPNSRHQNLNGQLGGDSAEAGPSNHISHVNADSSGAGQNAQQGLVGAQSHSGQAKRGGLVGKLKGARHEMARARYSIHENGRNIPVRQQGAPHSADMATPFSSFQKPQQEVDCLSQASVPPAEAHVRDHGAQKADPGVEWADLGAERADLAAERADPGAERADPGAEWADHKTERAEPGAERADHRPENALSSTVPKSAEETASGRMPDEMPSPTPEGKAASVEASIAQTDASEQQPEQPHTLSTSHQSDTQHSPHDDSQPGTHQSAAQQRQHAKAVSNHQTKASDAPKAAVGAVDSDAISAGAAAVAEHNRGSKWNSVQSAEDTDAHTAQADGSPSPMQASPEVVETVRAGDSDDDVEIMDCSPVRGCSKTLLPSSSDSLQGLPQHSSQQPEQHMSPQPQQQPEPQPQQQWEQQHQSPPQHHQQQQQQQLLEKLQQQPPWQHQQSGARPAGQPVDLPALSDLASLLLATHRLPQHAPAANAHVKQEARSWQSHDSAHVPDLHTATAVAGSTSSHPVELSGSDEEGSDGEGDSTSSSVDPSQRVPAPWSQADTAASGQTRPDHMPQRDRAAAASGHAGPERKLQRDYIVAQGLTARASFRQQLQGYTPSNGQLRTKRYNCRMATLPCHHCIALLLMHVKMGVISLMHLSGGLCRMYTCICQYSTMLQHEILQCY